MKDKKDNKELQKVLDRISNGINSTKIYDEVKKATGMDYKKSKNKKEVKHGKLSDME